MNARTRLRAGLGFLAVTQFGVAAWALAFPRSFFAIPVVNMGMAYNEHLMLDYGALTLATVVVLGAAAVRMERSLTLVALVVYLVWAVAHFLIHVRLLHHLSPTQATYLMLALGAAIAIAVALLVLVRPATRRPVP